MSLDARGVYSGMGERGWNAAGAAAARFRSPRLGPLRGELSGRYRWSAHAIGQGTSVAEAELGLTASAASWADVSVAGKARVGVRARPHPPGHRRASRRARSAPGRPPQLGVDRTSFTEERLRPGAVFDTLSPRQDTLLQRSVIEYTDASLGARWRAGSFELGGLHRAATRRDRGAGHLVEPQRHPLAHAAARAGGRHRALRRRSRVEPARRALRHAGASDRGGGRRFSLACAGGRIRRLGLHPAPPGPDGLVALDVRAPGARSVELMGDFTDWSAVALARRGSSQWQVRLPVPPGIHHLVVRIDGGEWRAPPGSRPTVNEYGVAVGAVLVD